MGTRIVMLPGLGADHRLFKPQLEVFNDATVPLWLPPAEGEPVGEYALRLAESVIEPTYGEDWVAIGFSFGGIVALEMARGLPEGRRPREVGLLSAFRSVRSVSRGFRAQVAVGTTLPSWLAMPLVEGPAAGLFARMTGLDSRWTPELHDMAGDADWSFLVWAARQCCSWESNGRCPVPVRWMHGSRDRAVPYVPHPELKDDLTLVEGGSHLLTWTDTALVNAWIGAMVESGARRDQGEAVGRPESDGASTMPAR